MKNGRKLLIYLGALVLAVVASRAAKDHLGLDVEYLAGFLTAMSAIALWPEFHGVQKLERD